jgi:hypothetical protein
VVVCCSHALDRKKGVAQQQWTSKETLQIPIQLIMAHELIYQTHSSLINLFIYHFLFFCISPHLSVTHIINFKWLYDLDGAPSRVIGDEKIDRIIWYLKLFHLIIFFLHHRFTLFMAFIATDKSWFPTASPQLQHQVCMFSYLYGFFFEVEHESLLNYHLKRETTRFN